MRSLLLAVVLAAAAALCCLGPASAAVDVPREPRSETELLMERVAYLESRVFQLEAQAKASRGTGAEAKSRSWWFGSSKKESQRAAPTDVAASARGNGDEAAQPPQVLSHSNRGRLAHVVASGQKRWTDYMNLNAAVMTQGEITSLCSIPGKRSGYFATTTRAGALQVFHPVSGEIVLERKLALAGEDGEEVSPEDSVYPDLLSEATASVALQVRRNESKLLVGHANGDVYAYHFTEKLIKSTYYPEERVEFRLKEAPVRILRRPVEAEGSSDGGSSEAGVEIQHKEECGPEGAAITHLESFKQGLNRFYLAANRRDELFLIHENGTLLYTEQLEDPLVAMRPGLQQTVTLVTAGGLRMLDLRRPRKTAPIECEDLPADVRFYSAAFNSEKNSLAYFVTEAGDLVTMHVNSNKHTVRCIMKTSKALGLPTHFEERREMKMRTIKNYLFVSIPQGTAIFNTTGPARRPPREILFEGSHELGRQIGVHVESETPNAHLAARNNMCAVQIGTSVLGMYQSDLPVRAPPQISTKLWSQPIFLAMIGIGVFYQYNKVKRPGGGGAGMGGMPGMGGMGGMPGMGGMGGMPGMGGMGGMGGGDDMNFAEIAKHLRNFEKENYN